VGDDQGEVDLLTATQGNPVDDAPDYTLDAAL